jgi:GDP-4-dehydro-6-deoxy-D-mannose reductase
MIFYNGQTGSLGRYFSDALNARGVQGKPLQTRLENYTALGSELQKHKLNATEHPIILVQMAAMVPVIECEKLAERAFKTNVSDTTSFVRSFIHWANAGRRVLCVLYVSSGHIYKEAPRNENLREDDPLEPRSVYARTKLEAEHQLQELAVRYGFTLVIARVFGLIAPRQPEHYVLPGIMRRVLTEDLKAIPGLSCVRDYLDSRDVCGNLIALALQAIEWGQPGTIRVNVCSGQGVAIRTVVEEAINALRPDDQRRLLKLVGEAPSRGDEIPRIVGNPDRFIQLTGLQPQRISLCQTIKDAVRAAQQDATFV